MMDGPGGRSLTQEVIQEAVGLPPGRRAHSAEFVGKKEWFFKPWNAEEVLDPKSGKRIPFHEAPAGAARHDPDRWMLKPGDSWHGFEDIAPRLVHARPDQGGHRVPGHERRTASSRTRASRPLVNAYFSRFGIVPDAHDRPQVMFLFSIGITKGKWGTLLKPAGFQGRLRRATTDRRGAAASSRAARPERYAEVGLRDSATRCSTYMRKNRPATLLQRGLRDAARSRQ